MRSRTVRARVAAQAGVAALLLLVGAAGSPLAAQEVAPPPGAGRTEAESAPGTALPRSPAQSALPDSVLDALTVQVASQLRCVVCQGLSVQASPSDLAKEMKRLVREQLAAGRTPDQVKAYFVDRYGEFVLLEPKPAGFNLLVYLLPVGLLLGGLALVVLLVRRWTAAAPPDEDGSSDPEGGVLAGSHGSSEIDAG